MDDELRELRERITEMSDAELQRLVGKDRKEYRAEAIEFAREELNARQAAADSQDDEAADDEADDEEDADDRGVPAIDRQPCDISGGADLMVLMNAHQLDAALFLDIWRVDELRGISDEGEHLRIGALTTYTQLTRSPLVQRYGPALVAASRTIGAVQIQNRGTLGGNVVNASPAGDSLPVLAAYDAELEIGSARGLRRVAFNTFYTDYRQTVLAADELLVAVRLPKLTAGERDFFFKVGTRRAQAISKVVMAARAQASGRVIEAIRIAIGSVAPTVIRAP